jgi:hypothetical protein
MKMEEYQTRMHETRAKGEPTDDPNFFNTIPLMRTTIYIFSRTAARWDKQNKPSV